MALTQLQELCKLYWTVYNNTGGYGVFFWGGGNLQPLIFRSPENPQSPNQLKAMALTVSRIYSQEFTAAHSWQTIVWKLGFCCKNIHCTYTTGHRSIRMVTSSKDAMYPTRSWCEPHVCIIFLSGSAFSREAHS